MKSSFSRVSLEFDPGKKRITERNASGAATTTAEYQVVRNKLALLARHCCKWDEKKHALVKRKSSKCE